MEGGELMASNHMGGRSRRKTVIVQTPKRHRPPVVPPNPPKEEPQGRRIKNIDAKGRQRLIWEEA